MIVLVFPLEEKSARQSTLPPWFAKPLAQGTTQFWLRVYYEEGIAENIKMQVLGMETLSYRLRSRGNKSWVSSEKTPSPQYLWHGFHRAPFQLVRPTI